MNLTAITEEKEVYLKHFYDSVSLAFLKTLPVTKPFVMLAQAQDFQVFL